ncbi:hypothetical protein [Methylobacterium sp. Leaf118]|uniref:hypothetical protein n=1 Tax=Methylobacterium sp. Leaf118 TaxID=2876562 RepID=UPI001E547F89|nr:hypothetical protein [Methylobacterium sp. Leaf118]
MRERPPRSVYGRAIIGVIALYALVLHAFLGALAPVMPVSAGSEICTQHAAAEAPDEGTGCRHHACCTQVQGIQAGPPPETPFAALAWPLVVTSVTWRPDPAARARAPPDQGTSPRGPPAA